MPGAEELWRRRPGLKCPPGRVLNSNRQGPSVAFGKVHSQKSGYGLKADLAIGPL
jgi:hypothetical protein